MGFRVSGFTVTWHSVEARRGFRTKDTAEGHENKV